MKYLPIQRGDLPTLEQKLSHLSGPNVTGKEILDPNTWALAVAIPSLVSHGEELLAQRLRGKEFRRGGFQYGGKTIPYVALDQQAINRLVGISNYLFQQLGIAKSSLEKFVQLYTPQGIAFQTGSQFFDMKGFLSGIFGGNISLSGKAEGQSTTTYCGGKVIPFNVDAGKPYLNEMVFSLLECREIYFYLATAAATLLSLGNSDKEVSDFVKEGRNIGPAVNAVNCILLDLPFTPDQLKSEDESTRKLLSFYNALTHLMGQQPDLKGYAVANNNGYSSYNHYHFNGLVGAACPGFLTEGSRWQKRIWRLVNNIYLTQPALASGEILVDKETKDLLCASLSRKLTLALPDQIDPSQNKQLLLTVPKE